jgi:hypothetical protein
LIRVIQQKINMALLYCCHHWQQYLYTGGELMTPWTERRTISFILRLWVEPAATGEQPRWQGQIEHVGSGQITHFQIPAALVEFLTDSFQKAFPEFTNKERL